MNWKSFRIITSLLTLLLLSACGDDLCIRECNSKGLECTRECGAGNCVDADDWGYPKIYVSAEAKDLNLRPQDSIFNQYADAVDTHQVLIDADHQYLVIQIGNRDQWTSWFGGDFNPKLSNGTMDPNGFDQGRTVPDQECLYYLTGSAASPSLANAATTHVFPLDLSPATLKYNKNISKSSTVPVNGGQTQTAAALGVTPDYYADIIVPCYYRYGMGLYLGLAPDNGPKSSSDDVVLAYHIPDIKRPDYPGIPYDMTGLNPATDGYLVFGKPSDEVPGAQTGDRLYFKIVDNTYADNSGGYHVKIKSGTKPAEPGPLETIANAFVSPMKLVVTRIYNGIVQNYQFINAVRAALILYIVFYGFIIVMGNCSWGEVKEHMIFRIGKVALVFTLISPISWFFFYNFLFAIFLGGLQEVAGILTSPFGDYDPSNPWYSLDQLLARLWSRETWIKISSTLLSNNTGILFILAMLFGLLVFMKALVKAIGLFLVSFGGIAVLVILAPVMIAFILFGQTLRQTEEWLNHLWVFSIQQILVFAALGMFGAVIVMFMEKTIGYHVCWNVWDQIGALGINIVPLKFWMPDISQTSGPVWIDSDGDGIKEMVNRIIDLPYYDPLLDSDKISNYETERNFISLSDILIFLCSVFLMNKFMDVVPIMSRALKSTASYDSANIFGSGNVFNNAMSGAVQDLKSGAMKAGTFGYNVGKSFAKTDAGKYLGGKVKRATVSAGKSIAGAASYAAEKTGENISLVASRGLDKAMPSRASKRAQDAKDLMEGMGINIKSHQDSFEAFKVGAQLADQQIRGKGGVAKKRDEFSEQHKNNAIKAAKLGRSLESLGSQPDMSYLSDARKGILIKPIFDELKTGPISKETGALIANKSLRNIDNIISNTSKLLGNTENTAENRERVARLGLTIGDAQMINENLQLMKNASDRKKTRDGISVSSISNEPIKIVGVTTPTAADIRKEQDAFKNESYRVEGANQAAARAKAAAERNNANKATAAQKAEEAVELLKTTRILQAGNADKDSIDYFKALNVQANLPKYFAEMSDDKKKEVVDRLQIKASIEAFDVMTAARESRQQKAQIEKENNDKFQESLKGKTPEQQKEMIDARNNALRDSQETKRRQEAADLNKHGKDVYDKTMADLQEQQSQPKPPVKDLSNNIKNEKPSSKEDALGAANGKNGSVERTGLYPENKEEPTDMIKYGKVNEADKRLAVAQEASKQEILDERENAKIEKQIADLRAKIASMDPDDPEKLVLLAQIAALRR